MPARGTKKLEDGLREEVVRQAQNSSLSARAIYEAVRPMAEKNGWYLGGYDAVRKIVSQARVALPEDEPWSLTGSSELTDRLIPADALPEVLSVWMWHKVGATPFTVRQAKWAARLRGLVQHIEEHHRDLELAKLALKYASEERASITLKRKGSSREDVWTEFLFARPSSTAGEYDIARHAAVQFEELISREEGWTIPGAFEQRYKMEDKYGGRVDPPTVLDEMAHEIVDIAWYGWSGGRDDEIPSRAAVELVILWARRQDPSGDLWRTWSWKTKQTCVEGRLKDIRIGKFDSESWPDMW